MNELPARHGRTRSGMHDKTRDASAVGFSGEGRNMRNYSGSTKLGAMVSDVVHHHTRETGETYIGKDGKTHKRMEKYCEYYDRLYASLAMVTARLCPARDEAKKPQANPKHLLESMRA